MNICFTTAECVPYAKTGGLADVAGSLPKALARSGCHVKLFMPLYGSINTIDHNLVYASDLGSIAVQIGSKRIEFHTWFGRLPDSDVEAYFIDCPTYFHRPGLYTSDGDEHERFILLQHAAFKVMQRYGWSPDVIHCHDWHTALMPVMLRETYAWDGLFSDTKSLLTIHNIGYQGRFRQGAVNDAGLPVDKYYRGGPLEFDDTFSFLKAGLVYADAINTVSETYAREIQTSISGAGLDPLLAARSSDVFGIVNGIDTTIWNPGTDTNIAQPFDAGSLNKKLDNKKALLAEMGLPFSRAVPLLGIVSRLTVQKGFELLEPVLWQLADIPIQLVVLGSGEERYENFFKQAAAQFGDRVSVYVGFSDGLAHRITAGADMFLMPSAYEPCGMNQMFSMRYGTIPVVHKTGGLADTVRDFHEFDGAGNGFSFDDFSAHALKQAVERAVSVFRQPAVWRSIQERGMAEDFSWEGSARRYVSLYQHLLQS